MDVLTPEGLSAREKDSFAFITLRDRLPVIITKIIDYLHRERDSISAFLHQDATEDIKMATGELAKLKNEIQTDKPIIPLKSNTDESLIWDAFLEQQTKLIGTIPTWFSSDWLYVECYMYRRIYEAFFQCATLREFDFFRHQKEDAFYGSIEAIRNLALSVVNLTETVNDNSENMPDIVSQLMQVALWGNQCDLSLSAGADASVKENPITVLEIMQDKILVNDTRHIWNALQSRSTDNNHFKLAVVLDNAGFELFCDFCFLYFLTKKHLIDSVQFYVKAIPWYVSDTTENDFMWTVNTLKNMKGDENKVLNELGSQILEWVDSKRWTIEKETYWTFPFDYAEMETRDSSLYEKLSKSNLIVFKGDLNYRKLVGDKNWQKTISFQSALRGFHPAALCSLRTIKADVVVGMDPGQAEKLFETEKDWQITGKYAVIQFN